MGQARSDGSVSVREISREEQTAIDNAVADEIAAHTAEIKERLANPDLKPMQRTLLEIELRVAHLPRNERFAAKKKAKTDLYLERGDHISLKPRRSKGHFITPERREEIKKHPLFAAARYRQNMDHLGMSIAEIGDRIAKIEAGEEENYVAPKYSPRKPRT